MIKDQTNGLKWLVQLEARNHLARIVFLFPLVLSSQNDSWHTRLHSLSLLVSEDIHIYMRNYHNHTQSKASELQIKQQWVLRGMQGVFFMFLIRFSLRFQQL